MVVEEVQTGRCRPTLLSGSRRIEEHLVPPNGRSGRGIPIIIGGHDKFWRRGRKKAKNEGISVDVDENKRSKFVTLGISVDIDENKWVMV
jgi:hypothetical protein